MNREQMQQRLDELLADRALSGLTSEQSHELERLAHQLGQSTPDEFGEFDKTVAALDVALALRADEPMPDFLKSKIRDSIRTVTADTTPAPAPSRSNVRSFEGRLSSKAQTAPVKSNWTGRAGWLVAAVAIIAAGLAWMGRVAPVETPIQTPPPVVELTAAEKSQQLQGLTDSLNIEWALTGDEASKDASGKVVWNHAQQAGYMHFEGMQVNNPSEFQYQLWIFDGTRDERYPVDGGVFDIGPDGEVVVPINANIEVNEATLFAVTIEKPGGVMVSDRERIVVAASVGA